MKPKGVALQFSDFDENSPGEFVPVISGSELVSQAFVPDPLPPDFEWPLDLWPLLSDAESELARLDGTGKLLADPELLLTPLREREALKSSSLEGTYTDPEGQMLFKLDPKAPKSVSDPANAYREVFNYARALRLGEQLRADLPFSTRLIKQLHATLMETVRGQNKRPGELRQGQVHIGQPPRFVPPPAERVPDCLHNLEVYLNEEKPTLRPLVRAFIAHYQFETIHPFMDGNGRVGRLLLSLTVKEWCELSNQWLYMSAYFDSHKDLYIQHLYDVSAKGDWTSWLEFCLRGVVEQAGDSIRRCEALLDLQKEYRQKVQSIRGSSRLGAIVDLLFSNPAVQISPLADMCEVSYNTAKSDVEKLEGLGILSMTEINNVKTFYSPDILRITYE